MVSMVDTNSSHNDTVMDPVVPKSEPLAEGSISSTVSTPDPEGEMLTQDVAQTQKRKGGRKPIYATSEERKQRNRQAQAAFRERRTEYIRQLESTIKRNEDSLQTLQQNHRTAADECLMLRYKNSLLERILLEKGIDVQAELRLKTATPGGAPSKPPNPMVSKPPTSLERAAVSRNKAQRHPTGIAPKGEAFGMSQHREGAYGVQSPQFQATPSSHVSSPSHAKSPGFGFQGAISPASVDPQQQHRSQMLSHSRNLSQTSPPMSVGQPDSDPKTSMPGAPGQPRGSRVPSTYYPSPFQKHYDQLEQEYDAQADMIDDDHDSSVGGPPYYGAASVPGAHSMGAHGLGFNPQAGEGSNGAYQNTSQLMGNYEPILDTDPFGLSASMHFQTPFSYEQSNARQ